MSLPALLFSLFALFSAAGVFLIVAHYRGRRAAILGALLSLVLFAALHQAVLALLGDLAAG